MRFKARLLLDSMKSLRNALSLNALLVWRQIRKNLNKHNPELSQLVKGLMFLPLKRFTKILAFKLIKMQTLTCLKDYQRQLVFRKPAISRDFSLKILN